MLITNALVDASRIQFGMTALFHFLFAPLTLGLSWFLVMMEFAYLKTGKIIYKDMTRFWGKLFAINFAMGVVTGITLEFEFGQNWSFFSRYIGDAFGTALAIEGITAFMLEATMVGVFFFAWDRVSKWVHWGATILLAVGSNLSTLNILVANSWMQHPVHTYFNYHTMHMHLISLLGIYVDRLVQVRVGHVTFAGAMTASMFVIGISAFYLIKRRDRGFALRSISMALGFGLISVLAVGVLGDQNGLAIAKFEPQKMAAVEAVWSTPKAPAAWSLIAWPDQKEQRNVFAIQIPCALSLIATHSLTGTVEGEKQVIADARQRIEKGRLAYGALLNIRRGKATEADYAVFDKNQDDLGYGLLLKRYAPSVIHATSAQVTQAANDAIPEVFTLFYAFRIMLACWGGMLLLIILGLFFLARGTLEQNRWWLWCALFAIILPYLASEFGWVIAEVGRQPWTVRGYLPTYWSTSSLNASTVIASLIGFGVLYAILFVVELFLMFKFARLGPSSLGEGRYHFEK